MEGKNKVDDGGSSKAPSEREIFGICGPSHLSCVDWRVPDQRRSIAASIVQGVSVLERDRQQNRAGPKALATIWWDFFHFQCIQILVDKDSSTFGAIFEYKPHNPNHSYHNPPQHLPPKYVIAFRGTLIKPHTRKRDLYLDMQIAINGLTRNSRYQIALQAVQGLIAQVGRAQDVWLAGHSLGAAIALQVGKTMGRAGCYIETYLFNPPFASAPIEKLTNGHLKTGLRVASSVLTAGLSVAVKGTRQCRQKYGMVQHNDPFTALQPWIPYLFVNEKDPISCEYIGYFEHREKMEKCGLGGIERIATKDSLVSLVAGACGRDGEAFHLIPSAFVVKNLNPMKDEVKVSHGIHQWWEPHPYWHPKLYQFK